MRRLIFTMFIILTTTSKIIFSQFNSNNDIIENIIDKDFKKISLGYYLGINYNSLMIIPKYDIIKYYDTNNFIEVNSYKNGVNENGLLLTRYDNEPGISIGFISKIKLKDNLSMNIEPIVHFNQKKIILMNKSKNNKYKQSILFDNKYNSQYYIMPSTFIDIPLFLRLSGDKFFNIKPYIQTGLGYIYNLQSNKNKNININKDIIRNKNNISINTEIGIEYYLKNFKLIPFIRFNKYLKNEIINNKNNINNFNIINMKRNLLLIGIKFE